MLNDLPADIDTLDNLNISCLDPMLKDYVFSSFFFARLINKTMDENKKLKEENERLVAELGNCAGIRQKVEELKQYIDGLGPIEGQCSSYEKPDFKAMGFMARNRENMKELAGGMEASGPIPEADSSNQRKTEANREAEPSAASEMAASAEPEIKPELEAELEAPLGIPSEPEFDEDMNAISSEIVSEEKELIEDAFAVDNDVSADIAPEAMDITADAEPTMDVADISADIAPEAMDITADAEPTMDVADISADIAPEAMDITADAEPTMDVADISADIAPEAMDITADAEPTMDVADIAADIAPEAMDITADAEPTMDGADIPADIAPEPAPAPAVEIPDDPNAALTPEQIAAMFASSQSTDAPAAPATSEAEPAAEPEAAPAPAVEIPDDPNAALTPEQIAAMFAASK